MFESDGERVKFLHAARLSAKAKLPKSVAVCADRVRPEDTDRPGFGTAARGVLGAVLVPLAIPLFVLSQLFLGPDHWK